MRVRDVMPFTPDVFLSNLAQYNLGVWPAQIAAYVLGAVILGLVLKPNSRAIAVLLAAAWVWIGAVYHLGYFATINFAAPAFGALFIVQGLLLAWTGVIRDKLYFEFRPNVFGWTGLGLMVFAMAGYPLLAWLAGHDWPRVPMLGVTPGPTTIFTMGLLLLAEGRTPLHLVIIPVIWSLIGGAAVWLLDIPEDIVLPAAGIAGLGMVLWKNRSEARAEAATRG